MELYSNKKEYNTDTFYNMDELLKHYTKKKKGFIKGHKLHDSIYRKCPEQANLQKQKASYLGRGSGEG